MKIAILGYGKMGKAIEKLAVAKEHQLVLRLNSSNSNTFTPKSLSEADVAIEFSRPDTAFTHIKNCIEAGCPVVSGTTGWLDRKGEIEELTIKNEGAFLYASNFSIGVNLFFALNGYLAKLMNSQPQYAPLIEEIHHIQKLDAPSGTAISLAEQLIGNLERLKNWQKREGAAGTVPIRSQRIGDVPGTHHVYWESETDSIEIIHSAHSRQGFASGALLAAEWLVGRKGVFSMKDVLGF